MPLIAYFTILAHHTNRYLFPAECLIIWVITSRLKNLNVDVKQRGFFLFISSLVSVKTLLSYPKNLQQLFILSFTVVPLFPGDFFNGKVDIMVFESLY